MGLWILKQVQDDGFEFRIYVISVKEYVISVKEVVIPNLFRDLLDELVEK